MEFDNHLVKRVCRQVGFGNPFDATKIDNSALLPEIMRQNDTFLVHLGKGRHRFVKGIALGYHTFEPIQASERITWRYRRSVLNELDTSEANILSVASNQRIIHDFLYDDIVASPKAYNARRTQLSFSYQIGNQTIQTQRLQMEIDYTFEYQGVVTVVEGKNGFPADFAIYQLYHPFRYYWEMKHQHNLAIDTITGCYVLRKKDQGVSILRLYNYTFTDPNRMDSIQLLKKAEYRLEKR